MVWSLTSSNDTVQLAVLSGSAAFSVKGSTIHNVLGIAVNNREKPITAKKSKVEGATQETACSCYGQEEHDQFNGPCCCGEEYEGVHL